MVLTLVQQASSCPSRSLRGERSPSKTLRASRVPGIAHANIMPQAGSRVEGVLYELREDSQIRRMDPFEGHPHAYARELLTVHSVEGDIPAWVYIALPALTLPALKPA
ncbi:gamma-glutamylcyclotransferase family protein [Halomonas sp. WWR20]